MSDLAETESVAGAGRARDGAGRGGFRRDVLAGLAQPQKAVPARWFYDETGSALFEDITRQPQYYLTQAETEILASCGEALARSVGPGRAVIELGSGSSAKTPHVLEAVQAAAYVPIDISDDFLHRSAQALAERFPALPVLPLAADFVRPLRLPPRVAGLAKLGFFPGSTIGNLVPFDAVNLLRSLRATLGPGSLLLIGMDLIKDRRVLLAAYDDPAGVTAAFNLNLVDRINRELKGDLPRHSLRHEVVWNEPLARIEMHLQAVRDLGFTVAGRRFAMREGETIHTENSHKYDGRSAAMLLLAGGWTPLADWRDRLDRFAVFLATAAADHGAP